ncbi:hypothetical protein PIB30_105057, partial [Stylosanthes scabra]|nr:hypothetical protein [Stylosanthes scabra]
SDEVEVHEGFETMDDDEVNNNTNNNNNKNTEDLSEVNYEWLHHSIDDDPNLFYDDFPRLPDFPCISSPPSSSSSTSSTSKPAEKQKPIITTTACSLSSSVESKSSSSTFVFHCFHGNLTSHEYSI